MNSTKFFIIGFTLTLLLLSSCYSTQYQANYSAQYQVKNNDIDYENLQYIGDMRGVNPNLLNDVGDPSQVIATYKDEDDFAEFEELDSDFDFENDYDAPVTPRGVEKRQSQTPNRVQPTKTSNSSGALSPDLETLRRQIEKNKMEHQKTVKQLEELRKAIGE